MRGILCRTDVFLRNSNWNQKDHHYARRVEPLAETPKTQPILLLVIPTNGLREAHFLLKIWEAPVHVSRRTVTPSNGTFISIACP
jgi:hypothetical protein